MTAQPAKPNAGPHATNDHTAEVFVALLDEQRELYERVQSVGRRQAELIDTGDTQGLLAVLQERQGLINTLTTLNRRLIPHREAWSRSVDRAAPERRERVRALLDQTQQLLAGILEQDEADRKRLEGRFQRVGSELKQVGQAAQASRAYGNAKPGQAPPGTPRYTDQRG